jgi:hypothetical protein
MVWPCIPSSNTIVHYRNSDDSSNIELQYGILQQFHNNIHCMKSFRVYWLHRRCGRNRSLFKSGKNRKWVQCYFVATKMMTTSSMMTFRDRERFRQYNISAFWSEVSMYAISTEFGFNRSETNDDGIKHGTWSVSIRFNVANFKPPWLSSWTLVLKVIKEPFVRAAKTHFITPRRGMAGVQWLKHSFGNDFEVLASSHREIFLSFRTFPGPGQIHEASVRKLWCQYRPEQTSHTIDLFGCEFE